MDLQLVYALHKLEVSRPKPGTFDITDPGLVTKLLDEYRKMRNVLLFYIPMDRIEDLLTGEAVRSHCGLIYDCNKIVDSTNRIIGKSFVCRAGKMQKKHDQDRVGIPVLGAPSVFHT